MAVGNNGLLAGMKQIAARLRALDILGGIPGAPLGFRLRGAVKSGPPATGTWLPGDVVTDRAGAVWTCTTGGTPGQWSGTVVTVAPTGDQSGAKDTAAVNTVIQAGGIASLVSGAVYYVTNLLPDTYGGIYGNNATITAATGATGNIIALKTPATTRRVVIRDLIVNCNQVCAGVLLDNTGFTPAGSYNPYDPMHVLDNVLVLAANGDGFHFDNQARELRVSKCKQYFASGYGFYLGPGAASSGAACTDSHFTDCTSGQSGNHGFYLAAESGNNMLTSCKSFWAGYNEGTAAWGTTECGFEILCSNSTLAACSAQQAALHGFDLNGCSYVTMAGCQADTNSAGTTGGVGVNTSGATNCSVVGTTGVNNGALSPGAQAYGIQVAGTQTGTVFYGNSVTGSSGHLNYVSGGGYQSLASNQADFGGTPFFKIPSPVLAADGQQALSNGSTIPTSTDGNFAVVPCTASAAVTGLILEAPAAGAWTQVVVSNESAYTMTFAASGTSNVVDGVNDVILPHTYATYVYDGSSSLWYPYGGSGGGNGAFVTDQEQFVALTTAYTLSSTTALQKLFNASSTGALTVAASTSYFFECLFDLTLMVSTSTNGNFSFGFGGTATLTSVKYTAVSQKSAALTTPATPQIVEGAAAAATQLVSNTTGADGLCRVKGIIRINGGGTIIPEVAIGVATSTAVVGANSYFRIWPVGSNTVTDVGNWS